MTNTNIVFDNKGNLVLKKHKRELEEQFVNNEKSDDDDIGFIIPNEDFNDMEILTSEKFVKEHSRRIHRRRNAISFPSSSTITLQRDTVGATKVDKVERLSALETQQKYALLARASYFEGDEEQITSFFSGVPKLNYFKLDKEVSSQKNSVFVNSNTGEVVISYKGTNPTNFEDLYDDVQIVRSQENNTSRFRKAENLFKTVQVTKKK